MVLVLRMMMLFKMRMLLLLLLLLVVKPIRIDKCRIIIADCWWHMSSKSCQRAARRGRQFCLNHMAKSIAVAGGCCGVIVFAGIAWQCHDCWLWWFRANNICWASARMAANDCIAAAINWIGFLGGQQILYVGHRIVLAHNIGNICKITTLNNLHTTNTREISIIFHNYFDGKQYCTRLLLWSIFMWNMRSFS